VEGNHGGKGNEARRNWKKDMVVAGTARALAQDKMVHADCRNLTDWWASFWFLIGLCARRSFLFFMKGRSFLDKRCSQFAKDSAAASD